LPSKTIEDKNKLRRFLTPSINIRIYFSVKRPEPSPESRQMEGFTFVRGGLDIQI